MIPVIGIPHLGLFELLDGAVHPLLNKAEKIHVIDNSTSFWRIQMAYPNVVVSNMHHNLGVGASWNLIIKLNPWARYWVIINNDVRFGEGDLEALEEHIKWHDVVTFGGMAAFAIRASAIQKAGWFDENFVPAYFEDNDYHYRCRLLGVSYHQITDHHLEHLGSRVIRDNDHYRTENGRTFPRNQQYYAQKWGGPVDHETYTTPFDRGGSPRDWTLDMTRLTVQAWKE